MKTGVLILCGGLSSRMGTDKGLLPYKGQPMLQHVLGAVAPLDLPVWLSTGDACYERFGYPLIADEFPEKGPLGGLYSGLKNSGCGRMLVLACDTPYLTVDLLRLLLQEQKNEDALAPSFQGKTHPLTAVYHCNIMPLALRHLESGNYRMMSLCDAVNCRILDLSDHPVAQNGKVFLNMNTPEDLDN